MKKYLRVYATLAFLLPTLAQACSTNNPEVFAPFFSRFSNEQGFAVQRTDTPLRMLRWEYGLNDKGQDESSPVTSSLSREEYAKWPSLKTYMQANGLQAKVKSLTNKAAVVDVYKDGSDWLVLYHFKRVAGCWRFWQYEDQSL